MTPFMFWRMNQSSAVRYSGFGMVRSPGFRLDISAGRLNRSTPFGRAHSANSSGRLNGRERGYSR